VARSTGVTGAVTKSMEWVRRLTKMEPRILAIFRMDGKRELASTSGKKESNTLENGLTTDCKDTGLMNGLTAAFFKVSGTTG